MTGRVGPAARLLCLLVAAYRRFVSPLLPARCRFAPSCSAYAYEALQAHGAVRGGWLAVRRIARCHPFHPGGHDPVPVRDVHRSLALAAPAHRPGRRARRAVGDHAGEHVAPYLVVPRPPGVRS